MMIQLSGKSAYLAQKCHFYHKTKNKQSWKFSKSNFWPKSNIQNSAYTKSLSLEL